MNANVGIPENVVVLQLATLTNLCFHVFFYHSCIVTTIFNRVAVFYRCIIIENVYKGIFNGNKYIAH